MVGAGGVVTEVGKLPPLTSQGLKILENEPSKKAQARFLRSENAHFCVVLVKC